MTARVTVAPSSSAIVRPLTGSRASGAISASGTSTNASPSSGRGISQMARARDDPVVEQHDVDVERAARIARPVAAAAVAVFERVQPRVERDRFEIGIDADREIQEFAARRSRRPRNGRPARRRSRRSARAARAIAARRWLLGLDVRAEAEIRAMHRRQRVPRSMTTPTACAPRTAPGLDSFSRSQRDAEFVADDRGATLGERLDELEARRLRRTR